MSGVVSERNTTMQLTERSYIQCILCCSSRTILQCLYCPRKHLPGLRLHQKDIPWRHIVQYSLQRRAVRLEKKEFLPETIRLLALIVNLRRASVGQEHRAGGGEVSQTLSTWH